MPYLEEILDKFIVVSNSRVPEDIVLCCGRAVSTKENNFRFIFLVRTTEIGDF